MTELTDERIRELPLDLRYATAEAPLFVLAEAAVAIEYLLQDRDRLQRRLDAAESVCWLAADPHAARHDLSEAAAEWRSLRRIAVLMEHNARGKAAMDLEHTEGVGAERPGE